MERNDIVRIEFERVTARRDFLRTTLHADLNLRIALHAELVYSIPDPVLQQTNSLALHVSRTAAF